jgi:hypothetical protein
MLTATRLGDGWLWLAAAALLVVSGNRGLQVLSAGAVSAGVANALLVCVKRRVRRARPCERAKPRHFDVDPLAWFPSDRFSFPSGHALNAFAIGTVIALAFPPALAADLRGAAPGGGRGPVPLLDLRGGPGVDEDPDVPQVRPPTIDDIRRICRALDEAGAHYVLIGGFAVILHGGLRTTMDGTPVIVADVETLIRTKMTVRPSDAADRAWLESLREDGGR